MVGREEVGELWFGACMVWEGWEGGVWFRDVWSRGVRFGERCGLGRAWLMGTGGRREVCLEVVCDAWVVFNV